jgi:ubiquinone biosynthesis protein Coq4
MRYANEVTVEELKRDRDFLRVYFADAIISLFKTDERGTACLMLRDIVNATITFPKLAEKLEKKDKGKGLMQMLTQRSNPNIQNLGAIIDAVLEHQKLEFSGATIDDKNAA